MKTEAVAYCRVSGQGQTQGSGLDRQEEAVRAYAKNNGYEIQQVYRETHTGTKERRPVFADMLADLLDNGCRVIIVECLDRLARDLAVQMQICSLLSSRGITLINAMTGADATSPSDPMAKAMLQMQGCFAELDKSLLVKKLKKGRQAKRQKTGSCEGRKAFGFRPGESDTLNRMKELRRKRPGVGRLSYCRIAKVLNSENLPTRTGIKWSGVVVGRILGRQ